MKRFMLLLCAVYAAIGALFSLHPIAYSARSIFSAETCSLDFHISENAYERLPIASVTKIMTAVVTAQLADPDEEICVPAAACGIEGSSAYLRAGERLTVRELLYALMLSSANDAATALALHVGGSEEGFVALMNAKARALCMNDTYYVNPHGLPSDGQYSCARDQALLASYARTLPEVRAACSAYTYPIRYDGKENGRYLVNHNRLLRSYNGCIGMKTGYTKEAGRCLVTCAERDGVRLVCVTLGDPDDWNDHKAALDAGFATFERVYLSAEHEQAAGIPLAGGGNIFVTNVQGLSVVVPREREEIKKLTERPRFLYGSETGTVGEVGYYLGEKLLGKIKLEITRD